MLTRTLVALLIAAAVAPPAAAQKRKPREEPAPARSAYPSPFEAYGVPASAPGAPAREAVPASLERLALFPDEYAGKVVVVRSADTGSLARQNADFFYVHPLDRGTGRFADGSAAFFVMHKKLAGEVLKHGRIDGTQHIWCEVGPAPNAAGLWRIHVFRVAAYSLEGETLYDLEAVESTP
jgi:hypothetical protein